MSPAIAATPKHSILIVDDDPTLRRLCGVTLRHAGFAVTEVESGETALVRFTNARFDLVLLDVQMGGLNGYETCLCLRSLPGGSAVPVIMLTGLEDAGAVENAYDAGATDFIAKPFHWELLTQRVRYALRAADTAESSRLVADSLVRAQRMAQLGTWSMDLDGSMQCSEELARVIGLPADQLHCISPTLFLERVARSDRDRIGLVRSALAERGEGYDQTYVLKRFDGVLRTVYEQAVLLRDARGSPQRMEFVTQDITDRVEAEQRIRQLSSHDSLTGLPNRENFQNLVAAGLERARALRKSCALLHLDLDRFKGVNDALGVASGDSVLKALAGRLGAVASSGRAQTTTGSGGTLGRVGSNAICIFLDDITDTAEVVAVAQRMLAAVAEPLSIGANEIRLAASVGISVSPRDAVDSGTLLLSAEQALYAAKRDAPGNFLFFDASISDAASSLLVRETDLRRALNANEMRAYLQPKIDARSGVVVGAEALIRWEHPERGLVAPAEFIPIAEKTGLIGDITEWMLDQAGRIGTAWKQAGLAPVPVSVNISPSWFMGSCMLQRLDEILGSNHLDPSCIVLEVTESLLVRDIDKCIALMHALRERGIAISLDDFGTGYSSLSYLKAMPLNELKLDRSFVTDIGKTRRDQALAAAVVSLANTLDLSVVAEGVETAAQAATLMAMGCHIHQGYLYGRPIPAAHFSALLLPCKPAAAARRA